MICPQWCTEPHFPQQNYELNSSSCIADKILPPFKKTNVNEICSARAGCVSKGRLESARKDDKYKGIQLELCRQNAMDAGANCINMHKENFGCAWWKCPNNVVATAVVATNNFGNNFEIYGPKIVE